MIFAVCHVDISAILGGRDGCVGTHVPTDILDPTDCLMCEAIAEPSLWHNKRPSLLRGGRSRGLMI